MARRKKSFQSLLGSITIWRPYYHCRTCCTGHVPWDHTLRLGRRGLTLAVEELSALAGTLTDFEENSQESLKRMCGIRLSAATVRRVTEEAGAHLCAWKTATWSVADSTGLGRLMPGEKAARTSVWMPRACRNKAPAA